MAESFEQKNIFLQRVRDASMLFLTLFVVGLVTRPIEGQAWRTVSVGKPEMNLQEIEGALGQGIVIGVLGGFRTIIADFLWIRTNKVWEDRDRVKLDTMIRLVTTLDPRPDFFWINGARMIAYDVPNWRIEAEGGPFKVAESRQQEIDQEQSNQAFVLLEQARKFHPEKAKFYLETGQIYLNRLKDTVKAAEWFLLASQKPNAPYYAARIYAELLRREGKNKEAYAFLKQLYRELPDEPLAQKPIILDRIRELEVTLKVPVWRRFKPGNLPLGAPEERSIEQSAYLLEQTLGGDSETTPNVED